MNTNGHYVAIEGNDGSGKSTLVAYLVEHHGYLAQPFPTDGPIGKLIRQALSGEISVANKSLLYLFAADCIDANQKIASRLLSGRNVVADRHPAISAAVFQSELHSPEWIGQVYATMKANETTFPAAMFILHIPAEAAIERIGNRGKYKDVVFESEDINVMNERNRQYEEIATTDPSATLLDGTLSTRNLANIIVNRCLSLAID